MFNLFANRSPAPVMKFISFNASLLFSTWCLLLPSSVFAQTAASADRNAVNTAARPGDMTADSPVAFPKDGPIPAKYPPDVKEQGEPVESFLASADGKVGVKEVGSREPTGRLASEGPNNRARRA